MSDYTKGPWSVGRMLDPKDAPAIIGDEDSVVAILPGKWNHCSYIAADALLIAAAPELLDLAEAIFSAADNGNIANTSDEDSVGVLLDAARAAIAKATGEKA